MKLVLFVALLAATLAFAKAPSRLSEENYELLFSKWTEQHTKNYATPAETLERYQVWKSNLDYIRRHNAAGTHSHTLRMNQFGDMTNEEFRAQMTGFQNIDQSFLRSQNYANLSNVDAPTSIDWVKLGKVVPIKDQGQCGSCWAFSAVGSTESAYAIDQKTSPISLSEQQLVDCSTPEGNQGCNGGLMDQAFQYIISHPGLCKEGDYPYQAADGQCKDTKCKAAVCITAFSDVPPKNEDALQAALATRPVSVAVDAGGLDWQFYFGGVMADACGTQLDHGVLAVGYDVYTDGTPYWKVKNSWGSGWGMNGYVLLKRGTGTGQPGECGITLAASYPTGAKQC